MPRKATPRATSRLRSAPPENVTPPISKVIGRKRSMSVVTDADDVKVVPRKRGRHAKTVQGITEELARDGKATSTLARGSRSKAINSLKSPVYHARPPLLCFIFGNGDMGQFGLGTETLGEISHPRLHAWFETAAKGDVLGSEGAGVEKIHAGGMHTLVVDEVGKVWSWGINDNGSLGRPTTDVPDPDHPQDILEAEILETQPLVVQNLVDEGFRAVDVSAGDSVSVALGQDGDLRVWGSFRSSDGLLGFDGKVGSPKIQFTPLSISSLEPYQFVSVACGTDHVLALTTAGHVYTWGSGQAAQLGRRIIERRKVNGLSPERLALRNIVLIGTGSYHSFAVNAKGNVFAWGLNNMRQTGVSEEKGGNEDIIWQPTEIDALRPSKIGGRKVIQISGGEHHTLFLLDDGSVWGCGRCDGHEVGLSYDHPAAIELRERRNAARNLEKTETTGAGKADGEFPYVEEFIAQPVPVLFPPKASTADDNPPLHAFSPNAFTAPPANPMAQISAGTRYNLAVSREGHVYSWGTGSQCELGLGSNTEVQKVPSRVKSKALEGWKVECASAGGQHCVLLARKFLGD